MQILPYLNTHNFISTQAVSLKMVLYSRYF